MVERVIDDTGTYWRRRRVLSPLGVAIEHGIAQRNGIDWTRDTITARLRP